MDIIQREHPRVIPSSSLRVYENSSFIGYLIDISENGIMILSDAPVAEGKMYTLTVKLARDGHHQRDCGLNKDLPINFSGLCRWMKRDDGDKSCFLSGFQVTEISDGQRRAVEDLIRQSQMD